MNARKNITGLAMIVVVFCMLLGACSIERKLGKEFRETWQDTVLLVLKPEYVFKNNLKRYLIENLDSYPEPEQDSLLLENSLFLKQLSDSVIIDSFTSSFIERMVKHGFRVLEEPSMDAFMSEHRTGVMVNLAQMSLEEFVNPYSFDYDMSGESLTVSDIDLNAVNFNIWVEVSQLNSENHHKVLFASDYITDEVQGYFRQFIFSGEIQFEYAIDTLNVKDINDFISGLGNKYGDYLYDYFLNAYVRSNVSVNYPMELRTLHWNPETRLFQYIGPGSQFIEIE